MQEVKVWKRLLYYFMPAIMLWAAFAPFGLYFVRGLTLDFFLWGPLLIAYMCVTWLFVTFPATAATVIEKHTLWCFLVVFCGVAPVIYSIRQWYRKPERVVMAYLFFSWVSLGMIVLLYMGNAL